MWEQALWLGGLLEENPPPWLIVVYAFLCARDRPYSTQQRSGCHFKFLLGSVLYGEGIRAVSALWIQLQTVYCQGGRWKAKEKEESSKVKTAGEKEGEWERTGWVCALIKTKYTIKSSKPFLPKQQWERAKQIKYKPYHPLPWNTNTCYTPSLSKHRVNSQICVLELSVPFKLKIAVQHEMFNWQYPVYLKAQSRRNVLLFFEVFQCLPRFTASSASAQTINKITWSKMTRFQWVILHIMLWWITVNNMY